MYASKPARNCSKRTSSRLAGALLLAATIAPMPTTSQPKDALGESKASAIEVCRPEGQRAYLSRLVCGDGASPHYRRVGSFGNRTELPNNANTLSKEEQNALLDSILGRTPRQAGEPDYHIVDVYEVACGSERRSLYMDMYHCDAQPPGEAPPGFTMRPEK